jgi:DNA-cytosine methyltransferase
MKIRYGELFSGIGVGSLAFKNVFKDKAECAFFSEIHQQRIKAYSKHFPDHKNVGNIDFVDLDRLPQIDVLIGGSPCQDLSIARGAREGLDGDQSGLFYKFLDVIKEKKPKYFILENVASMRDEDRDEISRCLGVKPVLISSKFFTGQDRERYYWCNFPIMDLPTEEIDPRVHIDKTHAPDQPLNWKVMHTVWCEGKKIGKTSLRDRRSKWDFLAWSRSTRYPEFDTAQERDEWLSIREITEWKSMPPKKKAIRISYVEQRVKINMGAHTLVTGKHCARMSAKNMIRDGAKVRMLNRKECLRLQGLPDDYLNGLSDSAAYAAIGDSFTLGPIEHILKSLKEELMKF